MAREKKTASSPVEPQQEEITVFVLKFKGASHSMQKGFDAVNQAIAALAPTASNNHRVIVQHKGAPQLPPGDPEIIDAELADAGEETGDGEETVVEAASAPPASTKPKKPLAPKQSFLSEFNLMPPSVPSWKEFADGKNPQTETDKFLVASLWTQTHGGVDPFTGSYLFTCFRAMDWKTQIDMVQPLRQMKSKKSYYENPGHGKWKLTAGAGIPAAEKVGKE